MPKREERVDDVEHNVVYKNDSEFAAWPHNGGMWRTGDGDILVGFIKHECDYSVTEDLHDTQVVRYGSVVSPVENKQNQLSHARIETYGDLVTMRSEDQGDTWERDATISDNVETSERVLYDETSDIGSYDFSNPDVLLSCWSAPNSAAGDATPWIKVSENGGQTWSDPVRLPKFDFQRIQGRPTYMQRSDGTLLLMVTGKRKSDPHDVPIVYASFNGGENWTYLSQITKSDQYRTLCPSPVQLDDGTILAAVRCKISVNCEWTEIYRSDDDARSWSFVSRANDLGAPGVLLRYNDHLICIYGYRHQPYGIRARVSADDGTTWGAEQIIREDGANYDLGYPRAVLLDNGMILTTYYFNQSNEDVRVEGGPRYIASSRFDAASLLP